MNERSNSLQATTTRGKSISTLTLSIIGICALVFAVLSIWGAQHFMESSMISGLHEKLPFTAGDWIGFCLHVFCLPISLILTLNFISHFNKSNIPDPIKAMCMFIFCILFFTLSGIVYHKWASYILDCGVINCMHYSIPLNGETGYVPIVGTYLFFICLCLGFSQLFFLIKLFRQRSRQISSGAYSLMKSSNLRRKRHQYVAIAVLFLIFFPFIILVVGILPPAFDAFTADGIKQFARKQVSQDHAACKVNHTLMCPEYENAVFHSFSYKLSDDVYVKVFPDVLIFYTFIYVISFLGLLSQIRCQCFDNMHKRHTSLGLSYWHLLFLLTVGILLITFTIYWGHDHAWHYGEPKTAIERCARTLGQVASLVLSLLMLPISRNSAWPHVFKMPWESTVFLHRYLGIGFVVLVFCHMCFWWGTFSQQGFFPHDIFSVPMYYPRDGLPPSEPPQADNFTIQIGILVGFILYVVMGILSYESIRRKHFELFYYSHHFFLVIFGATLWHANSIWYYLLPGLFLWIFDRCVRFIRSNRAVSVIEINQASDGQVTELILRIGSGLQYQPGQYVFLNVPSISAFEWHPFSISSSPSDQYTTFHIRDMGPGTFTSKLLSLAKKNQSYRPPVMSIDGPHGLPISPNYNYIILVAGGIGITPLHSNFRFLYYSFDRNYPFSRVHLIWVVRKASMLEICRDTWKEIGADSFNGVFTFSFFVTRKATDQKFDNTSGDMDVARKKYSIGRPDLDAEIAQIVGSGSDENKKSSILMTCGPAGLQNVCKKVAKKFNMHFHSETFEL